ncbi:MAG: hypothetical protein RJA70_1361 [Pseudomonadota bacterium]|jgi:RNA polymerase sigma-70 factor (ECF subfamily)
MRTALDSRLAKGSGSAEEHAAAQARLYVAAPSFDEVYDQHFGFVWRTARGLGVPEANVDDAVQEVFMIVHRKLPSYEPRGSILSWLFAIARRVAKDCRRSNARRDAHELTAADSVSAGDDPQRNAATRQLLRIVEAFTEELDEDRRALFVLAQVEGLPLASVAQILGINPNTAYSRLQVLRKDLAGRLQPPTSEFGDRNG